MHLQAELAMKIWLDDPWILKNKNWSLQLNWNLPPIVPFYLFTTCTSISTVPTHPFNQPPGLVSGFLEPKPSPTPESSPQKTEPEGRLRPKAKAKDGKNGLEIYCVQPWDSWVWKKNIYSYPEPGNYPRDYYKPLYEPNFRWMEWDSRDKCLFCWSTHEFKVKVSLE